MVEYKGKDRWHNAKPDRDIGRLWEALSEGKCAFVMVAEKNWGISPRRRGRKEWEKISASLRLCGDTFFREGGEHPGIYFRNLRYSLPAMAYRVIFRANSPLSGVFS